MYEYKIINTANRDGNCDSVYDLNKLAKEGWELVAVNPCGHTGDRFYFKRRISTEKAVKADAKCDHEWEPCNAVQCEHCGIIIED